MIPSRISLVTRFHFNITFPAEKSIQEAWMALAIAMTYRTLRRIVVDAGKETGRGVPGNLVLTLRTHPVPRRHEGKSVSPPARTDAIDNSL